MTMLELAFALLATGNALADVPIKTAAPALPDGALPEWMAVAAPQPRAGAAVAWQALWRRQNAANFADDSVEFEAWMANPDNTRFHSMYAQMLVDDGDYAGRWLFFGEDYAAAPIAASRMVMPTAPPYVVRVELYCDEAAGDCAPLRQELATWRAPKPLAPSLMGEWVRIIAGEPCTPGPVQMPAPRYPSDMLMDGADGRVIVQILYNRCGEVRDAWVHTSSGHRALDRAAVAGALKWRVPVPDAGLGSGQAWVPIDFRLDDSVLAPDAR